MSLVADISISQKGKSGVPFEVSGFTEFVGKNNLDIFMLCMKFFIFIFKISFINFYFTSSDF